MFTRQPADEIARLRSQFDLARPALIGEWERHTGQVWPRYAEDVVSKSGTRLRQAGQPFDAHHIIELKYGSANAWWNIHPARFPTQHQSGIHRGIAKRIFS